jgi:hypothetical protein
MHKEAVKGDTPRIRDARARADEEAVDEQKPAKRFDLSVPQVAGSAVASVAAAIAASQLGVYGTVIGAGVMSIVATTGGSVFQHLFRRTGEQLRDAAGQVMPRHGVPHDGAGEPVPPTFLAHPEEHVTGIPAPRAGENGVQARSDGEPTTVLPRADGDPTAVLPAAGADPTTVLPAAVRHDEATRVLRTPSGDGLFRDGSSGDALPGDTPSGRTPADEESRLLPAVPAEEATRLLGAVPADEATRVLGTAGPAEEATRVLGTAGPADEATRAPRPAPAFSGAPVFSAPVTHQSPRKLRGWRKPLLTAVGVFAVSMAGITGYELIAGHPLSGGSGSTIGKLGGSGGGHHGTPPQEPTRSPSTGTTDPAGGKDGGTASRSPEGTPSPDRSQSPQGSTEPSTPGDTRQREQQEQPAPSTTPAPTPSPSGTGQEADGGTDPGTGNGQGDTQQPEEGAATPSP